MPSSILRDKFGEQNIEELLQNVDVYCTMEPCSIRTSGLAPCTDALINAKVKRCFIGVNEPNDFVICEGVGRLRDAGVEVHWMPELTDECLAVARRGRSLPFENLQ
jgi:pyrimidine deaminase RibD-like protein